MNHRANCSFLASFILLLPCSSGFVRSPICRLRADSGQDGRATGNPRCWGVSNPSSDSDVNNNIVDVDFERVSGDQDFPPPESFEMLGDDDEKKSSLLDLSLNADPRWKTTRIPFSRGDEYIDAKLAFMVQLEGVQYGIGVPYDDAVAIIVQDTTGNAVGDEKTKGDNNGLVTYVDPDLYYENDEYQELMEIMAAKVQEEFGEEFALRKTPKVLTISGGLSRITDKWERELLGEPMPADEMMEKLSLLEENKDEDIEEFLNFMKAEIGEEEFEKTMREDLTDEDRELMKFFEVPGLGTKKDDIDGLEALMKSIEEDLNEEAGVSARAKELEPDTKGRALKLVAFDFAEGKKSYALVKLLQPYVLVGKYCGDDEILDAADESRELDFRFELLSQQEEQVLIPRLEDLCGKNMIEAGLSFENNKHTVEFTE